MPKWKPNVHVASLIVSLTGFLFGYDAGSIGPITEMDHFFFLTSFSRGLVVASLLAASLPFSLIAGSFANKYGRVPVMVHGAILGVIGTIVGCLAFSLAQYVVGRVIVGAGQGLYFSISGVWQVESAPTAIRGRIGAMTQLFIPIGVATGFFVSYGAVGITTSASWRLINAIPGIVTLLMAILLLTPLVPESPRWLLLHPTRKRLAKAEVIVKAYARTIPEGDRSWEDLKADLQQDDPIQQSTDKGLMGILVKLRISHAERRRAVLSILLFTMVASSGIDAVTWYLPLLLMKAGVELQSSTFVISGIISAVLVLVTVPALLYFIDHIRRRVSIGIGALGMTLSLIIVGAFSVIPGSRSLTMEYSMIALIGLYLVFCQVFFVGQILVLAVEILPNNIRSTVGSLGRSSLSTANIILAATSPKWIEANIGSFMFTIGAFNLFTFGLVLLCVPETIKQSLEQIDETALQRRRRSGNERESAAAFEGLVPLALTTPRNEDTIGKTSSDKIHHREKVHIVPSSPMPMG